MMKWLETELHRSVASTETEDDTDKRTRQTGLDRNAIRRVLRGQRAHTLETAESSFEN
jgi:hypothetical protein